MVANSLENPVSKSHVVLDIYQVVGDRLPLSRNAADSTLAHFITISTAPDRGLSVRDPPTCCITEAY